MLNTPKYTEQPTLYVKYTPLSAMQSENKYIYIYILKHSYNYYIAYIFNYPCTCIHISQECFTMTSFQIYDTYSNKVKDISDKLSSIGYILYNESCIYKAYIVFAFILRSSTKSTRTQHLAFVLLLNNLFKL